jgi:uncharacterized protein (TIGR03435 family)
MFSRVHFSNRTSGLIRVYHGRMLRFKLGKQWSGQMRSQWNKISLTMAGVVALTVSVVFSVMPVRQLWAQSPSVNRRSVFADRPTFEVASVKPNKSTDFRNMQLPQFLPGGKLVIRNVPLQMIVAAAYNLPFQSTRLTGGPEWERASGDKYDIEATAEKGAIAPGISTSDRNNQLRLMLQSLLEERFKLVIRGKPKEQPVYALVVAKGAPKLQKSKLQEKDCVEAPSDSQLKCHSISGGQGRGIHGDAVDIADVALFVQNWTDLPVVDKTGLKDLYNIQTDGWVPMRQRPPAPDGTLQGGDAGLYDPDRQTLFDVFTELGLRMESRRAVVDMFVVEHVERPSEN